jgi:hypothetical protein
MYITTVLSNIQASHTPESLPQIAATLEDLQSFKALKDEGAISTSTCYYQLSAPSAAVNSAGGTTSLSIEIVNVNDCSWRARSLATWLQISSGQSGNGPGSVSILVSFNNTGSARAGVVVVGDQLFRVLQGSAVTGSPQLLTGLVSISSSGLLYSRASLTFNGTLTITNTSGQSIAGPLEIVVTGLPQGVILKNAAGMFNGNPYVTVPGISTLTSGESATSVVQFSDPSNSLIHATLIAYSGIL